MLIAGAANLFVGAIKLAAGIMVGSSAMLAEAAHSAADTLNQGFLLASVHRGERPADARHPFGYGQERYFWSLLAAFGIFIAGAGFSVFEGVLALRHGSSESPFLAYVVLAISAVVEGTSLVRVLVQFRNEARGSNTEIFDQVRSSPDTTVKAALFEDSAAMVGLGLAALGLALRQLTGSPVWDGAASIAIGCLLVAVAFRLGLDSRDYLIGRAATPRDLEMIRAEIENARALPPSSICAPCTSGRTISSSPPRWRSTTTSAPTAPRTSPTRSTGGSSSGSRSSRTSSLTPLRTPSGSRPSASR